MTEIRDFTDKIITNPAFLIDVNWLEKTNCFDEYRIKDIIMNIADEHICGMVIRYIITSWYDTCELILDGKDDFDELVYKRFWGTNGDWKYVPIEDDEDNEYELPSIEDTIRKILKARNNAFNRKAQKQKMDAKAREKELNQKSVNKCGCMESAMPDVLCTTDAEALFAKLKEAGIMDDRWQPINLSIAEKGTLVEYIAEKLDIRNKWKLFGMLWKTDSETLRTAKARGLDQEKTWEFRNKLDNL